MPLALWMLRHAPAGPRSPATASPCGPSAPRQSTPPAAPSSWCGAVPFNFTSVVAVAPQADLQGDPRLCTTRTLRPAAGADQHARPGRPRRQPLPPRPSAAPQPLPAAPAKPGPAAATSPVARAAAVAIACPALALPAAVAHAAKAAHARPIPSAPSRSALPFPGLPSEVRRNLPASPHAPWHRVTPHRKGRPPISTAVGARPMPGE